MNGAERIAAERRRQIEKEGYTLEHDQAHANEALAWAAACYAAPGAIYHVEEKATTAPDGVRLYSLVWHEPWPTNWRKASATNHSPFADRIRDLERAGALIAAEIDRLLAQEDGDD